MTTFSKRINTHLSTLVNTLSGRGSNYNQIIDASVIKGLKVSVQPYE